MAKRPRVLRSKRKIIGDLVVVNPDAAGIDAGSEEHWVSVPEDRSDQPVRSSTRILETQPKAEVGGRQGSPTDHSPLMKSVPAAQQSKELARTMYVVETPVPEVDIAAAVSASAAADA
jgi:hypothetical protein